MLVLCAGINVPARAAQTSHGAAGASDTDTLGGVVLNSVTHEPIARALVVSQDNRFATMTDDRGRFEFTFPHRKEAEPAGVVANAGAGSPPQPQSPSGPAALSARKPGFVSPNDIQDFVSISPSQQDITLTLAPEARVVGHVIIPGSDGSDRIQVSLYRRQVQDGRQHWQAAGSVTSRSDGEFRFAELSGGYYKLLTGEMLDRDPVTARPRGQLLGYPPVYYPSAADFGSAAVIHLSAGETFAANLSPAKREYYPIKLGIINPVVGQGYDVRVWPQGHPGPGYSLGYDPGNSLIEGSLPNGNYTVEVFAWGQQGQPGMSGQTNIMVSRAPVSGRAVTLLPNISIPVAVQEQFQHSESREMVGSTMQTLTLHGSPTFTESSRRPSYVRVTLVLVEDFGDMRVISLRPPTGPEDESLVLENVPPGRYRVQVESSVGFPSSVSSGGTDLLRQPLIVAPGAAPTPIEIIVRDDGGEVEGTIVPATTNHSQQSVPAYTNWLPPIYLVPTTNSSGQFKQGWITPEGTFQVQQVAPGDYRVFAFDRPQQDLEYATEEALRRYDSQSQVITVAAEQKKTLRLSLIAGSE